MFELSAIATKTPLPNVIETQEIALGSVRCVHVIPSGEVAATLDAALAIAAKTPLPNVTASKNADTGIDR
jgi:hypothetical protein